MARKNDDDQPTDDSSKKSRTVDESILKEEQYAVINPFATRNAAVRHRGGRAWNANNMFPLNSNDSFIADNNHNTGDDLSFSQSCSSEATGRPRRSVSLSHHWNSTFSRGMPQHLDTPGTAGFLEMEADPSRTFQEEDDDLLGLGAEPIRTTSGLLLTHRRAPYVTPSRNVPQERGRTMERDTFFNHNVHKNEAFEVDLGFPPVTSSFWKDTPYSSAGSSLHTVRAKRLLSVVRFWLILFVVVLLVGTGVVIHAMRHERNAATAATNDSETRSLDATMEAVAVEDETTVTEQIILIPFQNTTTHRRMVAKPQTSLASPEEELERGLRALREEFEQWIEHHQKSYDSDEEKERRFQIWTENHHRTIAKNERHGPCKLTKQPVFGSNHFKDLSPEEFQKRHLTGYKGPRADEVPHPLKRIDERLPGREPHIPRNQHRRTAYKSSSAYCSFFDISCWLRMLAKKYLYRIGNTLNPGGSYPDAIDWRDMGAVTDVHSQGNCGACWAITAVETIESAYFLKSGSLVELAESEVIVCDDTCEMCEGGWPQNAYEYVMENKGLPPESAMSYDGDFLLGLSLARTGESEYYDESYLKSYQQSVCPNGGGGSGSHSGDNSNSQSDSYSGTRYGYIRGYGYATDRCVCYSDGTGCDCDEQNEERALRNVATYGPATVCLEASLWQDYAGGVLTSEVGCSSAFLDMNHCVQAVGYAFVDLDEVEGEGGEEENQNSNSHSNSHSNSRDDGKREGYWIIRNQWSSNWGINGYAYVAIGENTCGVLNDMSQTYM